ncbi:MAG: ribonuclease R [Betaproteobacteria bacterium]|nr:ribonuclease R [Betaproteobacteria bacterium]
MSQLSKSRRSAANSPTGRVPQDSESTSELQFSGKLIGHRDGFGFIRPDSGGEDVFVSPREMLKAMHGDRVVARVTGSDRKGRPEAVILEVLEHTVGRLVGRLVHERGIILVVPEDQRIKHDIIVGPADTSGAQPGQVVMVEVLGSIDDPGMEVEIAVRKFDVPHTFSQDALRLADKLPDAVRPADVKGRVDLRDLDFMTIDGEDARDFDDAVFAESMGKKGYRLLVAIADVSHYVQSGDALDRDAFERATSVYFPRRVLPMLPEKLSNGLCSLNPRVERLALVCDMVVSPEGLVKAYQFYDAVIESSERLTYDRAWAALAHPTGPEARVLGPRFVVLETLYSVFKTLLDQRERRGAIELDTVETYIKTDDQGRIASIQPRVRNDAHRLIEECMLAANTCAADLMARAKRTGLYRVHEGPTPERLKALREFLKMQGLRLGGGEDPQPVDYARLSREIKQRPDARLLQTLLLRSMQQAIYTPDNSGHFGLAYPAYTHYTSPIRRYPDLLVHRVIKATLAGRDYVPAYGERAESSELASMKKGAARKPVQESLERWRIVGDHCSAAERRADDASRDVEAWLKCQFMKNRVGEQLSGTITGVAPFGVFVTLDSLYVEGLIHVSELGAEYFQHNEIIHELRGERTGRRFRLYDPVSVQVSRVDLDARRIEFRLVPSMVRAVKRGKGPVFDEIAGAGAGSVDESDEFEPFVPTALAHQPRGSKQKAKAAKDRGGRSSGRPAARASGRKRR